MSKDETPVPKPNEADRDDPIHYYEVDETDVKRTQPDGAQDDGTKEDTSGRAEASG